MRIAYADPPYPGMAHLYHDHPDYNGEVDHTELVGRLEEYDGWALSTSSKALQQILPLCPDGVRVLVWAKNTVRWAWEPVIVRSARQPDAGLRDWIHCEPESFQWRPRPDSYVIGQKPDPFCTWLFGWLGCQPDDLFDDLFPGSGSVGRAWERFRAQTQLTPWVPANRRTITRQKEKALRAHPTLDVPFSVSWEET